MHSSKGTNWSKLFASSWNFGAISTVHWGKNVISLRGQQHNKKKKHNRLNDIYTKCPFSWLKQIWAFSASIYLTQYREVAQTIFKNFTCSPEINRINYPHRILHFSITHNMVLLWKHTLKGGRDSQQDDYLHSNKEPYERIKVDCLDTKKNSTKDILLFGFASLYLKHRKPNSIQRPAIY